MDLIEIVSWMIVGCLLTLAVFTGVAAYDEHSFKQGR